jgi:hypothetical protein
VKAGLTAGIYRLRKKPDRMVKVKTRLEAMPFQSIDIFSKL